MPKKKALEISKEFVEQLLGVIANESEAGRKKIVAIAKAAEEKYQRPVQSWITGWIYQYTRTRGEQVDQSINVMETFPDAYTRLQEFKLLISDGEWKISSYNFLLFRELIDAVPDYAPIDPVFEQRFILELKALVMKEIDSFMAQYSASLEAMKAREIERQKLVQSDRQSVEHVCVSNGLNAAQELLAQHQDKLIFSLSCNHDLWSLTWIEKEGITHPLTPSPELTQKLATLKEPDIHLLSAVGLKRVKRECLKAREQYLSKVQVLVNPEDKKSQDFLTLEALIRNGVQSSFVLEHRGEETSLFWINSMGVANQISLAAYPQLESWLMTHTAPFNADDSLQLKVALLHVKTNQAFSASRLDSMNKMLDKVLTYQKPMGVPAEDKQIGKLELNRFDALKQHLEARVKQIAPTPPTQATPKKLKPEQYAALSKLPIFWQTKVATHGQEEPQQIAGESFINLF